MKTIQSAMRSIWCDILNVSHVALDSNIFDLGGNARTIAQIAKRANDSGLRVTESDLYTAQTIRALARAYSGVGSRPVRSKAGRVPIPLLPSQLRFMQSFATSPHRYNIVNWYEVAGHVDLPSIESAVWALLQRHKVFGLAIRRVEGRPFGELGNLSMDSYRAVSFEHVEDAASARSLLVDQIHSEIDIDSGDVVRVVLISYGSNRPMEILFVAHHLVCDALSWRVIVDELDTLLAGKTFKPIRLSYDEWSLAVEELSDSPVANVRVDYWQSRQWAEVLGVPVESPGPRRFSSVETKYCRLPRDLVEGLTTRGRSINQVVTGVTYLVWRDWLESDVVSADVYGHGRAVPGRGTFLDEIGWFASVNPLIVDLAGIAEVGAAVEMISEARAELFEDSVGLVALQNFGSVRTRDALQNFPTPELYLNYRGDSRLRRSTHRSRLREVDGPNGDWRDKNEIQPYKIEVTADLVDGDLVVGWHYSVEAYSMATISQLAERQRDELIRYSTQLA